MTVLWLLSFTPEYCSLRLQGRCVFLLGVLASLLLGPVVMTSLRASPPVVSSWLPRQVPGKQGTWNRGRGTSGSWTLFVRQKGGYACRCDAIANCQDTIMLRTLPLRSATPHHWLLILGVHHAAAFISDLPICPIWAEKLGNA